MISENLRAVSLEISKLFSYIVGKLCGRVQTIFHYLPNKDKFTIIYPICYVQVTKIISLCDDKAFERYVYLTFLQGNSRGF
jgi:hypothetical protein